MGLKQHPSSGVFLGITDVKGDINKMPIERSKLEVMDTKEEL